jgi:hypothetical protein
MKGEPSQAAPFTKKVNIQTKCHTVMAAAARSPTATGRWAADQVGFQVRRRKEEGLSNAGVTAYVGRKEIQRVRELEQVHCRHS